MKDSYRLRPMKRFSLAIGLSALCCLSFSSCATYKKLRTKPGSEQEVTETADEQALKPTESEVTAAADDTPDPLPVPHENTMGFRVPDLTRDLPSTEETAASVVKPPQPRQDDTIVPNQ